MFTIQEAYSILYYITYICFPIFIYFIYKKVSHRSSKVEKVNYTVIEKPDSLKNLINMIKKSEAKYIGVDTEYYRGDEYEGALCTIQIAVPVNNQVEVFIIDCLKIEQKSLSMSLAEILSNTHIQKVIHACDNDVEWIYDHLGIQVENVFDTQDIYQVINKTKKRIGLNHLINHHFKKNLDDQTKKMFQKSNWKQRPLSIKQLEYAAMDAHYLLNLQHILKKEHDDKGFDFEPYFKNFQDKINKKFSSDKKNRSELKAVNFLISNMTKCDVDTLEQMKFVYLEIFRKNDEIAQKRNINPEKILTLKTIYKIVTRLPQSKADLIMLVDSCYGEVKSGLIKEEHNNLMDDVFRIISTAQFESKFNENNLNFETENDLNGNMSQSNQALIKKILDRERVVKKFSCKKPVYENCRMQAPDGEFLSYCDHKKMNWYLGKGLAEMMCEDPPTFKLLFEPNARGCSDLGDIPSSFYVKFRKNCCVVCGNEENYMRFHVVPILYRKFFPNELKSHKSHDVVLLCFSCHEKANQIYEIQKKNLSEQYNVPINILSDGQLELRTLQGMINNCKTLHKNFDLIPADKKEFFSEEILSFFSKNKDNPKYSIFMEEVFLDKGLQIPSKIEDLSKDILARIKSYKIKSNKFGEKKNQHGKMVIDQITDFTKFIREWRVFFIEALQPKFLPDAWNVEHEFYRTFGEYSKFNKS